MRYYKLISDGYLLSIGKGAAGEEINADEYEEILTAIKNTPAAQEGKGYRLKADLTWEEYDVEPVDIVDEISDSEALDIILGGETA